MPLNASENGQPHKDSLINPQSEHKNNHSMEFNQGQFQNIFSTGRFFYNK